MTPFLVFIGCVALLGSVIWASTSERSFRIVEYHNGTFGIQVQNKIFRTWRNGYSYECDFYSFRSRNNCQIYYHDPSGDYGYCARTINFESKQKAENILKDHYAQLDKHKLVKHGKKVSCVHDIGKKQGQPTEKYDLLAQMARAHVNGHTEEERRITELLVAKNYI